MSPDPHTDRAAPDSSQDEKVYAKNEEARRGWSVNPTGTTATRGELIVDPKVYGSLLILGVALLIVGQSTLSMIGIGLLVIGAFIGIIDVVAGT